MQLQYELLIEENSQILTETKCTLCIHEHEFFGENMFCKKCKEYIKNN